MKARERVGGTSGGQGREIRVPGLAEVGEATLQPPHLVHQRDSDRATDRQIHAVEGHLERPENPDAHTAGNDVELR